MTLLTSEGKYLSGLLRNISRKCCFSRHNEHNIFGQTGIAPKPNEEHLHPDTFIVFFLFKYEEKVDCKAAILYCGLLSVGT